MTDSQDSKSWEVSLRLRLKTCIEPTIKELRDILSDVYEIIHDTAISDAERRAWRAIAARISHTIIGMDALP